MITTYAEDTAKKERKLQETTPRQGSEGKGLQKRLTIDWKKTISLLKYVKI